MSSANTGKKTCPTCAFSWVRTAQNADKKECPKCHSLLPASGSSASAASRSPAASSSSLGKPVGARPMGDKSPLAPSASSAMESTGGNCPKGGPHTYRFGKCSKCSKSEGTLIKGHGATANPGGAATCSAGGKHIFKFSKCTKCGASELRK